MKFKECITCKHSIKHHEFGQVYYECPADSMMFRGLGGKCCGFGLSSLPKEWIKAHNANCGKTKEIEK